MTVDALGDLEHRSTSCSISRMLMLADNS